jgi:hypothetical protein
LTETTVVARTTNTSIHYVGFGTRVLGVADVPRLMSDKLAPQRETIGIANLVHACVPSPPMAKSSSKCAPNRFSSSEVVAVKKMNDISSDALFFKALEVDIFIKTSKQPVGFGTDMVVASFANQRFDGVRGSIAMNLQVRDLQLLAESRHFVKLAGSSDNVLGERISLAAAASTGTERRVDDESDLNHVEEAAAFLKEAMVVIDSQMLGCIEKTTETAGLTERQDGLQLEKLELFVIQIVRGDRGIGVASI